MYTDDQPSVSDEVKAKLPEPKGYRILIAIPEVSKTTQGGVYIPDERRMGEETASIIGYVLKLGAECYNDEKKFPHGPYCAEGDFIIFRSYSGTRFKVNGQEFRLINDDTVEAVVEDPRGYARA
jgi:co-chaperonin GroES (HSP10)